MGDPCYSLYCKQHALERWWESPWACGFASLVTCLRLLGDRTTEDERLVWQFRKFGGKPREGMTSEDAVDLARAFGYDARPNPPGTRRDWDAFERWMDRRMGGRTPVMVSIDSMGEEGEADHWWVVHGDPDSANLWVMDPLDPEIPFCCLSRRDVRRFASCNDGEGFLEYDGVAISAPERMGLTPAPPSAALMEFLNEDMRHGTGWCSEAIGAALIDNHFSTVQETGSRGKAHWNASVAVSDLVDRNGATNEVIGRWEIFFGNQQRENMETLRGVLYDVEAHLGHRIGAAEVDHVAHDIALNLMLIATNLMDD